MSELKKIIDQVVKEKKIDRDMLITTLEEAIYLAARRKIGNKAEMNVSYNYELDELEVFKFKEVVKDPTDLKYQLSFNDAKEFDKDCEIGDALGIKLDITEFGRIAAQSAKQVIIQMMRNAERDTIFNDFKDRKNEIVNGIVQRIEKNGAIIVNLGKTEAILPFSEQNPREEYHQGDRLRAYVLEVKKNSRGPQIILSRTYPDFIRVLFALEVPEVADGIVTIEGIAREPGSRTKISVSSIDRDVDPVGACVGIKGIRVQVIVKELRGEKIDIVLYNSDVAKYVSNALAPAEIDKITINELCRTIEVNVDNKVLSLAIGRRGQNVRLASKLTGWKIDVKSKSIDYLLNDTQIV